MGNLVSQYRSSTTGGGGGIGGWFSDWGDRVSKGMQPVPGQNPVGAPGSRSPAYQPENPNLGQGLGASAGQNYVQNQGYWDSSFRIDQNAINGVRGLVGAQYAPQYAQYNDQIRSADFGLAASGSLYDRMNQGKNQDLWLGLAGNSMDLDSINVQRGNMPARRNLLQQAWNLDNEMYNQDLNWLNYTDQTLRQDRGFDERRFANQRLGVQQQLDANVQDLYSTSGASGNMGGGSGIRQRERFRDSANRSYADIGIEDEASAAGLERGLAKNNNERFGLKNSLAKKLLGFAEGNLNLDERNALFDIEAKKNGLSRKQLISTYEQEMAQLGLSRLMKVEDYAQMKARARMGIAQTSAQESSDIFSMAQAMGAATREPRWVPGPS